MIPRDAEDPLADLAPFVDPGVARRISDQIDAGLMEPGADEVTARHRPGPRLVQVNGRTYLLPTVIHCASASHPLANREFLFPFVSVVDVTRDMRTMPAALGSTWWSRITQDQPLIERLLGSTLWALNLGRFRQIRSSGTNTGNLFEHRTPAGVSERCEAPPLHRRRRRHGYGGCLRDNALAAALLARGHDVVLRPLYADQSGQRQRQRFARVLRRRRRPRAAHPFIPDTPALFDRLWDSTPC
jgi:hypothetical protein